MAYSVVFVSYSAPTKTGNSSVNFSETSKWPSGQIVARSSKSAITLSGKAFILILLQASVGVVAGSVLGTMQCIYKKNLPCVSILEPDEVACIFESARQADGMPHAVAGTGETIMAGLNCAEPCQIIWPILHDFSDFYFACSDSVAARGIGVLADPIPGGGAPISVLGESVVNVNGLSKY